MPGKAKIKLNIRTVLYIYEYFIVSRLVLFVRLLSGFFVFRFIVGVLS